MTKNYPSDYTTEEIYSVIRDFSKKIKDSKFHINTVMQLSPAIQLGQSEIQKRILEKSAKETARIQKLAIGIAITSLILSIVAIGLTYQDSRSETEWKESQLNLLKDIKVKLQK